MMRLHLASLDEPSDRAHLFLVARLPPTDSAAPPQHWIVDVALGSLSMSAPVRTDDAVLGVEQLTADGPRRVRRLARASAAKCATLLLEARHAATPTSAWRPVYEFADTAAPTTTPFARADMLVENARASSADSDLATRLIVTRCDAHRARWTLRNDRLSLRNADGVVRHDELLRDAAQLGDALGERFALRVDAAALDALAVALLTSSRVDNLRGSSMSISSAASSD